MTFGYHRVGIVAALANAVSLVLIAVFVGWEAIDRIRQPEVSNGHVMIGVAVVAIIVNLGIGWWLHTGSHDDLNICSAYLHMLGDAVSALGVVIAGVLVVPMHAPLADPVVSLLIAGLILYSSFGVLRSRSPEPERTGDAELRTWGDWLSLHHRHETPSPAVVTLTASQPSWPIF